MKKPLLRICDLHKSFTLHAVDGRLIEGLNGVDLDIYEGEHIALAGTSGAGKSSLLKCIHRTYLSDSGSIEFNVGTGYEITTLTDDQIADLREHQIGYVSQFLKAEPRRGVKEIVIKSAIKKGIDEAIADEMAAAILTKLNIDESLWGTYPTLLSGGEKQRVNLAAGIVVPPILLLLDEPVSALDPKNREVVLQVIQNLAEDNTTILSVFHDLDAMFRLADRVVVLSNGKVIDQGHPDEVINRSLESVAS